MQTIFSNLRFRQVLIILLLLGSLSACGIYSFTGASIPVQAKTFSVQHFPNHASIIQPTLSQRFTEGLQDKFARQTNLKMTTGMGDLHFEGAITGYTTQPQTIGGDDRAQQNRLTITVRVKFTNEYEPENNFERSFARFFDYPSSVNLPDIEDEAIRVIVEALVEDIFNQAVVNW